MARGEMGDEQRTILLVEDSEADAFMIQEAFEDIGARVGFERVTSGERAIARLEDVAAPLPDVLILDLALPGVGGETVLRHVRSSDRTRALRVVVLTGSPNPNDEARCRELGADGVGVKPGTPSAYAELATSIKSEFLS